MSTAYRSRQSYIVTRFEAGGIVEALALQTAPFGGGAVIRGGHQTLDQKGKVHGGALIMDGLVSRIHRNIQQCLDPIAIFQGARFGEQSIINRKPSYADYVCLAPTELLEHRRHAFGLPLFVQQPDFALRGQAGWAWRVQKTSETLTLMKLFSKPVPARGDGLAQLPRCFRIGPSARPRSGSAKGCSCAVPQNTLACCAAYRARCFQNICSSWCCTAG